jgi:hypothetical protein
VRWLSAAWKQICDGRRRHRGISPIAVDEKVVRAAPARWTMARMKREDAMQGSWFGAMDEERRSLAVDDAVYVGAPAWWRRAAMDGVVDGGGGCGAGVLAPTVYEWENGGRGVGGTMSLGRACLKCGEVTNLAPV